MAVQCPKCGHDGGEHDAKYGCNFQALTRYRCLCSFSPESARAGSFEAGWKIHLAEKAARGVQWP